MASRRYITNENPVREVNLQSAKLFESDLEFLRTRGIPVRTALREALHEHVKKIQSKALPAMTPEQRAVFILNGKVPAGDVPRE
ncbi:hypothetical protein [Methanoregula sp.]|uniref:hypothetical protein n=1 Tax=Methanoregula sp. TaxID=2052170 RepID=UPI002612102F|nr:hypothetical protein [Methanoregula sp.]MDD5143740.1 hypothetical protein [Methanoregula sp.]